MQRMPMAEHISLVEKLSSLPQEIAIIHPQTMKIMQKIPTNESATRLPKMYFKDPMFFAFR